MFLSPLFSVVGTNGDNIYGESIWQGLNKVQQTSYNTSFYAESNSKWFVVKFSCEKPTTIKEMYIESFSNCTKERDEMDFYVLIDSNGTIYDKGSCWLSFHSYSDLFIHLNYSFIKFDYEHLPSSNFSTTSRSWTYNLTLPPSIYYLICIEPNVKETHIRIWINATGNLNFLAKSEGNTTYLLDETDFLGKANIYWYNGSIVRKGKATFTINNTLVGYFDISGGVGLTHFKFIDPNSLIKKATIFDLGFKKYNSGWNHRRYMFGEGNNMCGYMINKTKGKWTISMDMLEFSGLRVGASPDIIFHYADVKLP